MPVFERSELKRQTGWYCPSEALILFTLWMRPAESTIKKVLPLVIILGWFGIFLVPLKKKKSWHISNITHAHLYLSLGRWGNLPSPPILTCKLQVGRNPIGWQKQSWHLTSEDNVSALLARWHPMLGSSELQILLPGGEQAPGTPKLAQIHRQ